MKGRALVTGAGTRLGREMAIYLGERDFDVAVHYAGSEEGAQETVDAIRQDGCDAVALQADLLDEDAAANLLPRAAQALGVSGCERR